MALSHAELATLLFHRFAAITPPHLRGRSAAFAHHVAKEALREHHINNRRNKHGSKQAVIVSMLRRPNGATYRELCDATGWTRISVQYHAREAGLTLRTERRDGRTAYFGDYGETGVPVSYHSTMTNLDDILKGPYV